MTEIDLKCKCPDSISIFHTYLDIFKMDSESYFAGIEVVKEAQ